MLAESLKNSPWLAARGSVIGRSHITNGTVCQDANDLMILAENPEWGIAAVSDGAGSCSKSELGSAFVVKKSIELFSAQLREKGWATGSPLPSIEEWKAISHTVLESVADSLRAYALENSFDFHSLSATAIVAIFGPEALLICHIGDGRAAGQDLDGRWKPLLIPFKGEEANATVFITSNIWAADKKDRFIGADIFKQPFRAFALMTDGCEMATFLLTQLDESTGRYKDLNEPFAPFFNPNVSALLALYERGKTEEEVNALWERLLTNGTERFADEPDDKTMILVVNREATREVQAQMGDSPSEKDLASIAIPSPITKRKEYTSSRKRVRGNKLRRQKGVSQLGQ